MTTRLLEVKPDLKEARTDLQRCFVLTSIRQERIPDARVTVRIAGILTYEIGVSKNPDGANMDDFPPCASLQVGYRHGSIPVSRPSASLRVGYRLVRRVSRCEDPAAVDATTGEVVAYEPLVFRVPRRESARPS